MVLFRKKFSTKKAVLIFLMILSLCMQLFLQFTNISANDTSNDFEQFITNVSITDGNGTPFSEYETPVEKNSRVIIKYDFAIPYEKAQSINDGDVYTMNLPKEIKILKTMSADLSVDSSDETSDGNSVLKTKASAKTIKDAKEAVIQENSSSQSVLENDESKEQSKTQELQIRQQPVFSDKEETTLATDTEKNSVKTSETMVKDENVKTEQNHSEEPKENIEEDKTSENDNVKKVDNVVKDEGNTSSEPLTKSQEENNKTEVLPVSEENNKAQGLPNEEVINSNASENNSGHIDQPSEIKENTNESKEAVQEESVQLYNSELEEEPEKKSLGTITIFTDNTVKIVFSDYAKNHPINVKGSFAITSYFDEEKIIGSGDKEIDFVIGDRTVPITINFKGEGPDITKKGSYYEANNEITWTITVDTKGSSAKNLRIVDKLTDNHEFVENFAQDIGKGNCEIDGQIESGTYDTGDRTFSYDIPDNFNGIKVIKFKTKPVESITSAQGQKEIENTVNLMQDDKSIQSATDKVSISVNYIHKEGKLIDNNSVEWTININPNKYTLEKPTVIDELPNNLVLDKESVTLLKDGEATAKVLKEGTDYTLDANNKFEYNFTSTINDSYILKFKTDIKENLDSGKDFNISNTAKLLIENKVYGESSDNIGIPKGISKSGKYIANQEDSSKDVITWTIKINTNKASMEKPVITDDIVGEQDYIENSISITDSTGATIDTSEYNISYVKAFDAESKFKNGTLTISFLNTITDEYTIKFNTKPRPNAYRNPIGTMQKFTNGCNLKIGSNEAVYCESNPLWKDLRSFDKTCGGYDEATNEITWKLDINKYKIPWKGKITIKDEIDDNQEFVKGDNLLDKVEVFKNGNLISDPSSELTCSEDADKNIIFEIKNTNDENEMSDFYEIQFRTKIIDFSNIAKGIPYHNSATFNCKDYVLSDYEDKLLEQKSFVTKYADNYVAGDSFINWKVQIKLGGLQKDAVIKDAVISDNLAEGLALSSIDSIKFFEVTPDGDIPLDLNTNPENGIKYTNSSRELIIPLPDLSTSKEYLLQFRTDIVNKDMESVDNTVSFTGKGYNSDSYTKVIGLKNQEIIGTGSGEIVGSIKITKKDAEDAAKNLEGAEFKLYKANNLDESISTLYSDSNGEVCFNNIEKGRYVVKEVNPPRGYLISEDTKEFVITNDTKNIEYTWLNSKKEPKSIKLTKVDENDKNIVLKDAEFGLYGANDNLIESKKTGEDGVVIFNNLENGAYIVKELSAPKGYSINEESKEFIITDNSTDLDLEYVWPNSKLKSIKLIKIRKNNPNMLLKDAEFGLYNSDKMFIESKKTGEDGTVIFDNLENGTYIVKEISAPDGYKRNYDEITITVDDNSREIQQFTIENERSSSGGHHHHDSDNDKDNDKVKGSIKVIKVDDENKALKGAEFGLYDLKGVLVESEFSNEEGIAQFNDVDLGSYVLKEIKGIKGYKMNALPMNITINSSSQKSVTIKNEKDNTLKPEDFYIVPSKNINTGNIKVVKVNSNNEVLSGAEIGLYNSNGMLINSKVSDSQGIVIFNNIPFGNYFIKEIKAPSGYSLSDERININLDSNDMINCNLLNTNNQADDFKNSNSNSTSPKQSLKENSITEKIKSSNVVKGVKKSIRSRLPQSGSFLDDKVLIGIGILLICTGSALFIKKKCKGWK